MIRLPYTGTYSLELVTAQNGAQVVVCYSDATSNTYVGGIQTTTITSATTTAICATPAISTVRDVDEINIKNTFAGSHTITVQVDANATNIPLVTAALLTDESLNYTHGSGWQCKDANGNTKTTPLTAMTSAQLAAIVSDETGSGALVFGTNPSISAASGVIILPQTTVPAQTAEGSIVWDTDNDLLTVGDGTTRHTMLDTETSQSVTGVKTLTGALAASQLAAGTNTLALTDSKFVNNAIGEVSNPQQYAQGVALTAATSASNGITNADNANLDMGTGNFTLHWEGFITDTTPTANVVLDGKHDGANGWIMYLLTTGIMRLTINATNYDSTVALVATDNRYHKLTWSVTRESVGVVGSAVPYAGGYPLGASVTITAGAPTTVDNAVSKYLAGTSTTRSALITTRNLLFNRALTAAGVLSLSLNGVAESDKDGSRSALYTSDFSAGVDGFVAGTNNTITGNIDGINGSDNWLKCEKTVANGAMYFSRVVAGTGEYKRSVCGVTIYNPNAFTLYIVPSIAGVTASDSTIITVPSTSEVTVNGASFNQPTVNSTQCYLVSTNSTGTSSETQLVGTIFYVKTITISRGGTTLRLETENIQLDEWYDSTSNGNHATYPAAGFSFARPVIDNGMRDAAVALTGSATLTIAQLLKRTLTDTHVTGATATYTLPTATLMDAALPTFGIGKSFEWSLVNLSAAAADTATVAAGTSHTVIGNMVVQSSHATTGALWGNSGRFQTRKTAVSTYETTRIG